MKKRFHGIANHWRVEGGQSWNKGRRAIWQAGHQRRDVLQLEGQVWRHGGVRFPAAQGAEAENAKLKRP